jgi:hypothetical protein
VASAIAYPPDDKYDVVLAAAEGTAQSRLVGIWGLAATNPATPAATAKPTPKPTPTPRPTPTPIPYCTVVNLVGVMSNQAQSTWANAGFTGKVTFNPDWPPKYTITAQSLTPGTRVRCTSGITVQGTP